MDGCHFNNDCSQDTACLNQTCQDPCHPNGADGSVFDECGVNAVCQVISHAPTCKCPEGFRPLNSPYVACVPLDMDLEEITCLKVRLLDLQRSTWLLSWNFVLWTIKTYSIIFLQDIDCETSDSISPQRCRNFKCQNENVPG